jgi:nicotinamidase-related amidase
MPLTQLDQKPALIVIDLQKGVVAFPMARPSGEITAKSAALAHAFRGRGFPVILVNVEGAAPGRADVSYAFTPPADWAELVPQLERQSCDHVVTKHRWGAFHETPLYEYLQAQGVTQVALCGIATSMGVESTARNAHELGYNVVLVEDAMTDPDAEAHSNNVKKIFPKLGEVSNSGEVLEALASV